MKLAESVFIAPGAIVLGDVTAYEDVGIWYHATVRGDRASIIIGKGSNIQDNCVVHVDEGYPVEIGEHVTIGHGAIIHGSKIGDNSLIGMGAILLNSCVIGKNCIIGAGALVTQNTVIPDNSLVLGNPGKIKRELTSEEIAGNLQNAFIYVEEARKLRASIQ
uniref:gamma carbonic anhydrase family protein n=1 Tax=Acetatifactor sp. TaxID=1872090 RepID=UPI004055C15B